MEKPVESPTMRVQELKDPAKTFDFAKHTAIARKSVVVVMSGKTPIMRFEPNGDYSEIPAETLKVWWATSALDSMMDRSMHDTKRGKRDTLAAMGVLKNLEDWALWAQRT